MHVPPFDPDLGATLTEDAVVTASDQHDAPVSPTPLEVHLRGEVVARPGATPRTLTTDVHDDHFLVHSLCREGIAKLRTGEMEHRIRRLGI